MNIPTKKLNDGNNIPLLGLGTWQLTGNACTETTKTALELGYNHIDTADYYGNHKEIAQAIKGFDRKELFITSKIWPSKLEKETVKENCSRFLEELKTDYLDLLLIHWPSWRLPIKGTIEAMQELQEKGLVKSIGVSNFDIVQTKEALNTGAKIVTNQVLFHPGYYQKELLNYCNSREIKITAYSPIARGAALKNEIIKGIAENNAKTPTQVCLRWALQKGTIVIPKASSKQHLQENMQIFDWELKKKEIEQIDALGKALKETLFRKLLTKVLPFYKI